MQRPPDRRETGVISRVALTVFNSFSRIGTALTLAALLAACQGADPAKVLNPNMQSNIDEKTQSEVVQGTCPTLSLREGTAYFTKYAKGGDGDATKVVHQASISDTTRQCRISGSDVIMTVQASGRVVAGPEGGPGPVELPIRVVVRNGDSTVYSELTKTTVDLPAGDPTTQFLFTNSTVTFPANLAGTVKVWVGFDPGPYDTP
jgi:hypothetical protein